MQKGISAYLHMLNQRCIHTYLASFVMFAHKTHTQLTASLIDRNLHSNITKHSTRYIYYFIITAAVAICCAITPTFHSHAKLVWT